MSQRTVLGFSSKLLSCLFLFFVFFPHTTNAANVALTGTATASTERAPNQSAAKAIDGIVSGYPTDSTREWATVAQLAGAWIQITWPTTQTVSSVVLHDRINNADQIQSGILRFSDGSTISVGALPDDGTGLVFNFSAKSTTYVRFEVITARGENTGLAEIVVNDTSAVTPTPSPTPTPTPTPPPTPSPTPTPTPTPSPTPTPTPSGTLFQSGWENTTSSGCNFTALIDNVWEDYGGAGACTATPHEADIVTDVFHDGSKSLRVTQRPGNQNGTDFRIVKMFGNQSEVTLVGWVRYDSNYRWATGDHKIFIFMDPAQTAQNVYINYRGGSDPLHARLCMASIPSDAVYCATNPQVTVNTWYRIRVHIVAGSNGKVEMWLQPEGQSEQQLNLVWDAGNTVNINSFNVGTIGGFKLDTTYNIGSNITQYMYQWYDTIAVYSGLFGGAGITPTPNPTPTPTPTPSPTPTPTPSPTPTPTPSTKFTIGQRIQTTANVNVRATADTTGTLLGTQTTGSLGTVTGGPTAQGGFNWWNINYDAGVDGWSAEDFLVTYVAPTPAPTPTPTGPGTVIFSSGWENSPGTTCAFNNLTDNVLWNDYGPGSTCAGTPPIATISTTERNSGTKSLQVHFKDGDGGNGPDYRIVRDGLGNLTNTYFRYYIKWDSNWLWAGSDHKMLIVGAGNQGTQDVYFNIRGNSGGGGVGRLAIHVIPTDTVLSDMTNGANIRPGRWYLFEGHVISGANGRVEAKIDGVPLTLTTEAGNIANANNLNTGTGIGYVKLDTTYNVFTYFEANVSGNQSNVYYDDVAMCTGGWCGGVSGGVTPSPSPTPIAGDLNVDHVINSLDWSIMNSQWFSSNSQSDLRVDGQVNSLDFAILSSNWGRTW